MTLRERFGITFLLASGEIPDDSALIQLLRQSGNQLLVAKNGAAAIELLRNHPETTLVLLATDMEGMNGFDTLKAAKLIAPHIPVFLLSKYVSIEAIHLATLLGCNEIIQLPVNSTELIALFQKYLYQPHCKSQTNIKI
ncbi:MAG: response regulator [Bacteroidota bacterium]